MADQRRCPGPHPRRLVTGPRQSVPLHTITRHAMTEPRATPEQSPEIEGSRPYSAFFAGLPPKLLGLGKRLAAAEQRISELQAMHNTGVDMRLEQDARLMSVEQRISELEVNRPAAAGHAPAGSLVERVRTAILNHGDGGEYYDEARAAIRAVANAARSRDLNGQSIAVMTWEGVARWLEQEVERHG